MHSLFWPFSNREIILSMNFDGGRVKIEVRETLFFVFAGKFYRLYRAYILKGDDIYLSSDFFQSKLCFAYLNSRLIRPNQLETTFTGKKSTGECLKYNIFNSSTVYSSVAQWSGRSGGRKRAAVRVQASTEPSFFSCCCFFFSFFLSLGITCFPSFFFPFFNLLVCFPFIPTVGALSELHDVCDKRISELLGMIRCNKN